MPHRSASWSVLKAIATKLNVPSYTGAVSGATVVVTNDPSQAQATPYTAVTIASEERLDAMQQAGKSVVVELHHYSDYPGDLQVATMRNKAIELLHYAAVSVEFHTLIAVQYEQGIDAGLDEIAGVKRRHYVDLFRVDVKQAA